MAETTETAILAGGCFWGVQDLLRRYTGVLKTRVGYTGGEVANATYRNHRGHAEAIELIFDPALISYRQLLEFFFQIPDPEPSGQRYRRQLSLCDLLHQRSPERGRAGHHRRCRRLWPVAGQGGHRGDARQHLLGGRAGAPGLPGAHPQRLHLPLHPPGLEAPGAGGELDVQSKGGPVARPFFLIRKSVRRPAGAGSLPACRKAPSG